jgi:hypothetical protein
MEKENARRNFLRKYKISINPDIKRAEDNTWYVAITECLGLGCSSFIGVGSRAYRGFAERFEKYGASKIIAEQFDISPEVIDKITWAKGKVSSPLKGLIDRLNSRALLDAQKELSKLCGF